MNWELLPQFKPPSPRIITIYKGYLLWILRYNEPIDMYSLYRLIEHTGYHLGQIVDRSPNKG